jgi:rhodanese-related sulfurtransferase
MKPIRKPGTLLTRALFLVLAGTLAGLVANALRPANGIDWFYPWSQYLEARAAEEGIALASLQETLAAAQSGEALVLDARPLADYDAGHIPGALSLPMSEVEQAFVEMQLFMSPDMPIITYCSGPTCDEALRLAMFLRDQGYPLVRVFLGGMEEWQP